MTNPALARDKLLVSGSSMWGWGIGAATLAYAAAGNGKAKSRAKTGAYVFGALAGLSLLSVAYYYREASK